MVIDENDVGIFEYLRNNWMRADLIAGNYILLAVTMKHADQELELEDYEIQLETAFLNALTENTDAKLQDVPFIVICHRDDPEDIYFQNLSFLEGANVTEIRDAFYALVDNCREYDDISFLAQANTADKWQRISKGVLSKLGGKLSFGDLLTAARMAVGS